MGVIQNVKERMACRAALSRVAQGGDTKEARDAKVILGSRKLLLRFVEQAKAEHAEQAAEAAVGEGIFMDFLEWISNNKETIEWLIKIIMGLFAATDGTD